jgi:hypothetical protein
MVRLAPVAILSFINMIVATGAAQPATHLFELQARTQQNRPGHLLRRSPGLFVYYLWYVGGPFRRDEKGFVDGQPLTRRAASTHRSNA